MSVIQYQKKFYTISAGASVLETLEAAGVKSRFSCRNGVCQSCKKKLIAGIVPSASQTRLRISEQEAGHFLPCVCYPTEDITIADIDDSAIYETKLRSVTFLNHDIMEVQLEPPVGFNYHAGQYIQVFKDAFSLRTYSLSSVPALQEPIVLHVKLIPQGMISAWLAQSVMGDNIAIAGPFGECFYTQQDIQQPIVMVGTGVGLAPLYGILRDALLQGHLGEISLFHSVRGQRDLYHEQAMKNLVKKHPNFKYIPSFFEEHLADYETGEVAEIIFKNISSFKGYRVFLCGNPVIIKDVQKKIFLAGASMSEIYVDPFS